MNQRSSVNAFLLKPRIELQSELQTELQTELPVQAALELSESAAPAASAAILSPLTVHVLLEGHTTDATLPFVEKTRAALGDLKARTLYWAHGTDNVAFVFMPKDGPKGLGPLPVGTYHRALHFGSVLAQQLLGSSLIDRTRPVSMRLSEALIEGVSGEEAAFLLGVLQRSCSNKVAVRTSKTVQSTPATDDKTAPNAVFQLHLAAKDFTQSQIDFAQVLSGAMALTRGLINMPPNVLNPESYEIFVRELVRDECARATEPNLMQIDVINYDRLVQENCGLIRAVGQGSDVPPRLVKLTYVPHLTQSSQPLKHAILVGKGITFDTGGLNVKPSSGMRNMKKDMGGSASALGIFMASVRLRLPVRLTCYLSLAENMVSGRSMRPGDVYRARNGLAVEIDNTDAEGRLVLADALCFATEEKPDWIIDLATLTGAARVALGPMVDALFCNTKQHEELLVQAGCETGDWVWPLPLVDDYESMFDSGIADFMNSSTSGHGGAVTAALFLRRFVGQGIPWSHIDTYMWTDKPGDLWAESGATGKCVRLVVKALQNFAGSAQL